MTFNGNTSQAARAAMIWHDRHRRAALLQTLALAMVMLAGSWLLGNVLAGLSARGLGFGFGFLQRPAGYAIATAPVGLEPTQSHGRAVVVGLLNTAVVTGIAAVAALALGLAAAALRLSPNWLAGGVAAAVCAVFGAVPVLLWILMLATAFAALAATETAMPLAGGLLMADGAGLHLPAVALGPDAGVVAGVTVLSAVTVAALLIRWRRVRDRTGRAAPVLWPAVLTLILPPVAANLMLGQPVTLAAAAPGDAALVRPALLSLAVGLSLHGAARVAETTRRAVLAVNPDQRRAALALGLTAQQAMWLVLVPLAARIARPGLLRDGMAILRNSSLALAVGYMDVTGVLGAATLAETGRDLECLLLLAGFYLAAGWLVERLGRALGAPAATGR